MNTVIQPTHQSIQQSSSQQKRNAKRRNRGSVQKKNGALTADSVKTGKEDKNDCSSTALIEVIKQFDSEESKPDCKLEKKDALVKT